MAWMMQIYRTLTQGLQYLLLDFDKSDILLHLSTSKPSEIQ